MPVPGQHDGIVLTSHEFHHGLVGLGPVAPHEVTRVEADDRLHGGPQVAGDQALQPLVAEARQELQIQVSVQQAVWAGRIRSQRHQSELRHSKEIGHRRLKLRLESLPMARCQSFAGADDLPRSAADAATPDLSAQFQQGVQRAVQDARPERREGSRDPFGRVVHIDECPAQPSCPALPRTNRRCRLARDEHQSLPRPIPGRGKSVQKPELPPAACRSGIAHLEDLSARAASAFDVQLSLRVAAVEEITRGGFDQIPSGHQWQRIEVLPTPDLRQAATRNAPVPPVERHMGCGVPDDPRQSGDPVAHDSAPATAESGCRNRTTSVRA